MKLCVLFLVFIFRNLTRILKLWIRSHSILILTIDLTLVLIPTIDSTLSLIKTLVFHQFFSSQPNTQSTTEPTSAVHPTSFLLQILDKSLPISAISFYFLCYLPLISVLSMSRSKKTKFTPSSSSSQVDFRAFLKNPALEEDFIRLSSLEILPGRFVKYEDFYDYDIVSYLQNCGLIHMFSTDSRHGYYPFLILVLY